MSENAKRPLHLASPNLFYARILPGRLKEKPETADAHGSDGAGAHQAAINLETVSLEALRHQAHDCREGCHGENCADGKGSEIRDRLRPRREGQGGQDPEERGTACETMEDADAERGVSMMSVGCWFIVSMRLAMAVRMQVHVAAAVVLVFVGVHAKSFTQRPDTDGDQHHSDEPFTPIRDEVQGDKVAKEQGKHADDSDSRRVANAPFCARYPGLLWTPH